MSKSNVDFEPYFLQWDSVLFYGVGMGSFPAYQHRACKQLTVVRDKYPPRYCYYCDTDTSTEVVDEVELKQTLFRLYGTN